MGIVNDFQDKYWSRQRIRYAAIGTASLLLGFLFGFLAGYYGRGDCVCETNAHMQMLTREADESISSRLMEEINAENIGIYLK